MAGLFQKLFAGPGSVAAPQPDPRARELHQAAPFLLGMENAFQCPTIVHAPWKTSFRYKPQNINDGAAVHRMLLRLLDSACYVQHQRGYAIKDDTGRIISPTIMPEQGVIIERTPLDNGQEKLIVAYDFATSDIPPPLTLDEGRKYRGPKQSYLCGGGTEDWAAAYDLGIAEMKHSEWGAQCFAWEVDSKGWSQRNDLTGAPTPLFTLLLREVVSGTEQTNPLAPLSTEKGDAQFGWPDEWS